MYKNPKSLKPGVKIFFFYVLDFAIVIATIIIGRAIFDKFSLSPAINIFSYIYLFFLGLWLCIRTKEHPVDRNLHMIYFMLTQDKNRYHDFQLSRDNYRSMTLKEKNDERKDNIYVNEKRR